MARARHPNLEIGFQFAPIARGEAGRGLADLGPDELHWIEFRRGDRQGAHPEPQLFEGSCGSHAPHYDT